MNGVLLNKLLKGFSDGLSSDILIRGLQTDSRKVQEGDLFIAHPGTHTDGRLYIKEAIDKQAAAVFFDAHSYKLLIRSSIPLIPIVGLQDLVGEIAARFYDYPTKGLKIIGVTGTNGKTSCTHFIAQILQSQGIPCAVLGTLGYGFVGHLTKKNCFTTPDPLQLQQTFAQMRKKGVKAVAMEVSSHALDQRRVNGVHFNIAVFTQLSRDHLDYHGSMENYAQAKELLLQQIGLSYGVINCDDEFGRYLIMKYHKKLMLIGYSIKQIKNNHVPLVMATTIKTSTQGFLVTVQTPWGSGALTTSLFGRFNIINLLAVLGVLGLSGIPLEKALLELSKLKNVPGRMQLVKYARGPQVIVDYAHTPDALEKVLISLREHCCGRLICIFGCGGDRDQGKRAQMGVIAECHADQVIVTNDNPRSESPLKIIQDIQAGFKNPQSVIVETNRATAIHNTVQKATVDDIVLIAGKGHETTQIIGKEVLPFSDIQEAKKALTS